MGFLEADKETRTWLVRECFNPILISAMKRIDIMQFAQQAAVDETIPYSDNMIKGVVLDTIDFFAAGEIGEDAVVEDVCKTLHIDHAPSWLVGVVSKIRTTCLQEITEFQLAKYSFDKIPRDVLKDTVEKKISEPYSDDDNEEEFCGEEEFIRRCQET